MSPYTERFKTREEFVRTPLLDGIDSPQELKQLSLGELGDLADEMRRTIIARVSENGGHLASPLGTVELAIALHYVYDAPRDCIVWDVGHQSHPHKLLTGRRDRFHTIRKKGGISTYPRRSESPYDCFGVGHSSTSISAATGMAVARDLMGAGFHSVAVIGDGAITGGMAWEAMCHLGNVGTPMAVILNDNDMSISKNVGAVSNYLSRLITHGLYRRAKGDIKSFMEKTMGSQIFEAARRIEHSVKGMIVHGSVFEELGIRYVGPADGNDLNTLIELLTNIRDSKKPVLLHIRTQKGKGLPQAEVDPMTYHGVSKPYNLWTGEFEGEARPSKTEREWPKAKTFTDAFANALIEASSRDERVNAITAAMPTGTGLSRYQEHFPTRFHDVGICEQHAVTFAAGLATQGLKPVCAIYSTFLQRAYDQYLHDVCLQNLPVVFAVDRAGLVGEDSPTQQGAFDLTFLRSVPNVRIIAPRDDVDTALAMHWCLQQDGPTAMRYGRCKAPTIGAVEGRDITRGEILLEGSDATFLGVGPVLGHCLEAAKRLASEGYSIGVADARFVKPLDGDLIRSLTDRPIITVEENTLVGGFGSAVLEWLEQAGILRKVQIKRLGFADAFIEQATRAEQLHEQGLDVDGLCSHVRAMLPAMAIQAVK